MLICKYRKWIVFILDLFIIIFVSSGLFYLFPEDIGIENKSFSSLLVNLLLFTLCWAAAQVFFHTYDSLWRYAQSTEYLMLLFGGINAFLIFIILDRVVTGSRLPVIFSLTGYSVSFLGILSMRMCYRQLRHYRSKFRRNKIPFAIYGAGEAGAKLLEEIEANPKYNYNTVFFIDDSEEKIGKRIHHVPVKGPVTNLEQILETTPVREIVITIPSLSADKKKHILDTCANHNCLVRTLPDSFAVLEQGEADLWNNIRKMKIEELLGREQITLNNEELEQFLLDKTIMVTGGGGSIGSELCRQIAKRNINKLIIVDIYENNAYEIQQELLRCYGDRKKLIIEIASIRDKKKMFQLMEKHRPNIIFHAAAHKHVPLMENCPDEAIRNNIYGTYHLVQAADRYGVEKFVLISTDKAVNPTSIMGASKRICEMLLQSMKERSKTEFVAVRFGNVLGSNGSVIPLFQKQIAEGGPVTITDKRIVRYFMTITEAAELVLEAGAMANSSEVYVLDMGKPVKIIELAENLIRLSGHIPYTEIPIIETGLRPGEKLYEELLISSEELIATKNHKIFIDRQDNISIHDVKEMLRILSQALETQSCTEIRKAIKQVVPSYREPEEVNKRQKN
ncbi:FlaA1/EpsC-like NDP-sugar epimerase [Anaerotaenia torta]|uniref:polysaccharide biosynthesis protein n=1 Tax=Anaerotaenia torta TaxID=433293 RepID=UPI003D255775